MDSKERKVIRQFLIKQYRKIAKYGYLELDNKTRYYPRDTMLFEALLRLCDEN